MRIPLHRWAAAIALVAGSACSSSQPADSERSLSQELTSNGVTVTVALQSDWGSGYCANVTLQNASTVAVTGWTLVIDLNQATLSNSWSSTVAQSGTRLTFTPASFNATIAAGASTGFGYCANGTGANYHPTLVSAAIVGGSTSSGTGGAGGAGGSAGASGGAAAGGKAGSGGTAGSGGKAGSGGTAGSTGGTAGSAGSGGKAGSGGTGGASAGTGGSSTGTGGASAGTGGASAGGSAGTGGSATCDAGTTTTTWASSCATSGQACTAGTWVAGGPDPDHSTFTLRAESAHFAVYGDEATTTAALAQGAVTHLETVWSLYFGSPMYMREPLCNTATKYKASIHVHSDWGLTGGAWASNRMGMWIGTGGLSDHWGLAHEFMHGVQSVEGGMSCNQSNTCGWVYESHANWAAQQQAEYHTTNVHCSEMLANSPNLYLGSTRDRYCNWQFMEYLKDKFCYSAVNAIWTGAASNDPFTAIMTARGWNISQMNDFMGEWAMHNITWDYQDPAPESTAGGNQGTLFRKSYGTLTDTSLSERRLRLTKMEPMDIGNRRFVVPSQQAPQRWGYNIVRLYPDTNASSVTVTFRGVLQSAANSDFRWGLVATDSAISKPRYSKIQKGTDGSLTFCVNAGESLFLVVMGTPSVQQQIVWDQLFPTVYRYPYMVQLGNAWPDGYQGGVQAACPSGTVRVANGGGCGPASLPSSVYVGPYAQVLGGTVSGSARIDEHATILGGTVSGGTVSGLSIVKSGMTVSSGTERLAWPYAAGWFENPQSLSGGTLLGDIEYRGANLTESSGTYCGFVDNTISSNCTTADITAAGPYTWRP